MQWALHVNRGTSVGGRWETWLWDWAHVRSSLDQQRASSHGDRGASHIGIKMDKNNGGKNAVKHSRSAFNRHTLIHELHLPFKWSFKVEARAELMTQEGDEGQRWKWVQLPLIWTVVPRSYSRPPEIWPIILLSRPTVLVTEMSERTGS